VIARKMTPSTPSISIITPSFRQLDLLKLCAASVADQPGHVEHLIQDGGSGATFDEWASSQNFATCHSEADKGMYDAINRGFRKARGGIVCWLNCDEQYLPGALQKVVAFFDEHPQVDILFADVIVTDTQMRPLFYRKAVNPLARQIRLNFLPTYSAATFVRRRVIDEGQLLDDSFRAIADAEWIHRLLKLKYRTALIHEPLAVFMQTGENLGQSATGMKESRHWRQPKGIWDRVGARVFRFWHQWRKLKDGAYRQRRIIASVYHPGETSRRPVEAIIGGKWRKD